MRGGSGHDATAVSDACSFERLLARSAVAEGNELDGVREVARQFAYRNAEPTSVRLRWAKLSLAANHRLPDTSRSVLVRKTEQNLVFRTWVIVNLGRDDEDRDWNPDALADDTLAALWLAAADACALNERWRELPIERMRELAWHRSLTHHLDLLVDQLTAGAARDELMAWAELRPCLLRSYRP